MSQMNYCQGKRRKEARTTLKFLLAYKIYLLSWASLGTCPLTSLLPNTLGKCLDSWDLGLALLARTKSIQVWHLMRELRRDSSCHPSQDFKVNYGWSLRVTEPSLTFSCVSCIQYNENPIFSSVVVCLTPR